MAKEGAAAPASTPESAATDDTAKPAPGTETTGVDTKKDDKTPEDKGKEPGSKDDAAASKAPEKYVLALPDGGRIDAHDLAIIERIAREQGWSNEEAQARVIQHADAIEKQSARFLADTTADTVYGGAALPETLKLANAALDTLRPKGTARGDAFRTLLNKSGYGNHLEVVSLLADLGKQMAEDGPVGGIAGGGGDTKDAATLIYGDKPQAT